MAYLTRYEPGARAYLAASGGPSDAPAEQGAAPQTEQSSGAFTDLSGYLNANREGAQAMAQKILGGLSGQAEAAARAPAVSAPISQAGQVIDNQASYDSVNAFRDATKAKLNAAATTGGLNQYVAGGSPGETALNAYLLGGVGADKAAGALQQRWAPLLNHISPPTKPEITTPSTAPATPAPAKSAPQKPATGPAPVGPQGPGDTYSPPYQERGLPQPYYNPDDPKNRQPKASGASSLLRGGW